jgi:hypothetical protein
MRWQLCVLRRQGLRGATFATRVDFTDIGRNYKGDEVWRKLFIALVY